MEDHPLFGNETSIKSIKQDILDTQLILQDKIDYQGKDPAIKTPHLIEVN